MLKFTFPFNILIAASRQACSVVDLKVLNEREALSDVIFGKQIWHQSYKNLSNITSGIFLTKLARTPKQREKSQRVLSYKFF